MGYIKMRKNNLKCCREAAGMSQAEVRRAIGGVKDDTYRGWESGERQITEAYLKRIAKVLRCSIEDLTGESVTREESRGSRRLSPASRRSSRDTLRQGRPSTSTR